MIDPHAGYAAAVRAALPDAAIAVDHFHLVMLGQQGGHRGAPARDPRVARAARLHCTRHTRRLSARKPTVPA